MNSEKKCTICNQIKLIDEFSQRKLKNGSYTHRNQCKACRCNLEKQRRIDNLDKFKERDKEYYQKTKDKRDKEKYREYSRKYLERKKLEKKANPNLEIRINSSLIQKTDNKI